MKKIQLNKLLCRCIKCGKEWKQQVFFPKHEVVFFIGSTIDLSAYAEAIKCPGCGMVIGVKEKKAVK